MNKIYSNKVVVVGLIILFIGSAVTPSLSGLENKVTQEKEKSGEQYRKSNAILKINT